MSGALPCPTSPDLTPDSPPSRPRHVLLTGATGFLGQAFLEALLRRPDVTISTIVRPRPGATGLDRIRALLHQPAFGPWRAGLGPDGVEKALRTRIRVIEGDLNRTLRPLPDDLDAVLHSASLVTFDEPLDSAVTTNVGGPHALYSALAASGASPHVLHVSTAYVNTGRTDHAVEGPLAHTVDWRSEIHAVSDLRQRFERLAVHPTVSTRLAADAAGRPQGPSVATLRARWVEDQLRTRGRAHARDHGWTDVYTMTKALGERVAEDLWAGAGHRLTILRPTIIESALAHPYPGWIDGFKVADPLIAAYAKGKLVGFPGRPDVVLDIVPVDVVVAAGLAALDEAPEPGRCAYYQVGTGTTNPITLGALREHVQSYFAALPCYDRDGRPIRPQPWEFSTPERLTRWAARRARGLRLALAALERAPRALTRHRRAHLERSLRQLDQLGQYVAIYQAYTCSPTTYDDAATRALLRRDAARRPTGTSGHFDVARIDWTDYLAGTHLPSLVALMEHHRARRGRGAPVPTTLAAAAADRAAKKPFGRARSPRTHDATDRRAPAVHPTPQSA